jgi:hypothetical protein
VTCLGWDRVLFGFWYKLVLRLWEALGLSVGGLFYEGCLKGKEGVRYVFVGCTRHVVEGVVGVFRVLGCAELGFISN